MECNIDDLPDVLLEYILSLIPPYKNLEQCRLVSKRWFRAAKNVIQHNKARFHKSVACGLLLWSPWQLTHWGPMIPARHSHSACIYENSMYVCGGSTVGSTTFNDLWRLDLDNKKWVRPITMGSYPSPKACATMLYYNKSLILFGGFSPALSYPLYQRRKLYNELHIYSIESNKWIAINTLEAPPPMFGHSATIHENHMVVLGGISRSEYGSNAVWCLNLDSYTWHKQATSELKPQPRYGQMQVKLGDKHLLLLGGDTGFNFAMNDAWLLNMEGPIWTWRKVNIQNAKCAPERVWSRYACKVGNYIIVLSANKQKIIANDMTRSLQKVTCQRTIPPRGSDGSNLRGSQANVPNIDRDVNVNGRHGSFLRAAPHNPHPSAHSTSVLKNIASSSGNVLSMAAFRGEMLSAGINSNRRRQLESIRRMEEKIRIRGIQPKPVKKIDNALSIFVLDITNVLCDECTASWIPLEHDSQSGPNEKIHYSLVAGRGELIMFGGKETHSGMVVSEDSNDLHFISPPRYII